MRSRCFNTITLDRGAGTVTKESTDAKILDEISFLESVPEELSHFFPRVLFSSGMSYTMDYYPLPTLGEIRDDEWPAAAAMVGECLSAFRSRPATIDRAAHDAFYSGKFFSRVDTFHASRPDLDRGLTVNGKRARSVSEMAGEISDAFSRLYDAGDHCVMHGDLFFSNILFGSGAGIVKLLDPRGSFGRGRSVYGDRKYDLAKMWHSAKGGYDSFASDRYWVSLSGDSIDYGFEPPSAAALSSCSDLLRDSGCDLDEVTFIMGTLFVSMVPLHSESPSRQAALYAHGVSILNGVL